MGSTQTTSTYPIQAYSEKGYVSAPQTFPLVEFSTAIKVLQGGVWRQASTVRWIFRYPLLTFHFFLIQSPEFETLTPDESIARKTNYDGENSRGDEAQIQPREFPLPNSFKPFRANFAR